ncbi:MAG: TetR/AcrR family transcriptional regulator [Clostridia bacterium]
MEKISEDRKKEIIEKSKIIINEKGFDKISIRDIVKSVDMAQGLVYYYFKNKEEIVKCIVDEYVDTLGDFLLKNINKISSKDINIREKIEDFSQIVIDVYKNNCGPLKELDETNNKVFYQKIVNSTIKKLAGNIEVAIKDASQQGYIDVEYPKETTYMIIYGITNLIHNEKIEDKKVIASLIIQTLNIT